MTSGNILEDYQKIIGDERDLYFKMKKDRKKRRKIKKTEII